MHTARRRGKGRPRILYWFRTPPNVRVGRAPLDEEAIRAIEQNNPSLTFDWNKILEAQSAASEPRRTDRRDRRPTRTPGPETRRRGGRDEPGRDAPPPSAAVVEEVRDAHGLDQDEPLIGTEDAGETPPAVVVFLENGDEVEAEPVPQAGSPVEALVGAEGLARLRARYAELLARINERPRELEEADRLKQQAGELDPDSWVTDAEAHAALETYESRLEILRLALGPRKRRSRRGGARRNRHRRGSDQSQVAGGVNPLSPATEDAAAASEIAGESRPEPEDLDDTDPNEDPTSSDE